jgi:glycerol-3-phosphate dehydrogenase
LTDNEIVASFEKALIEKGFSPERVKAKAEGGILTLFGEVDRWAMAVDIGHMAAKLPGVVNVVVDITAPDLPKKEVRDLAPFVAKGVVDRADVVIIGGGITGCATARQLSKYKLDILLLERQEDLCEGTTKANNGMVHSGYDSKPGTLKAKYNVQGNAMFTRWAEELGFKFNRTGSFVCGFNDEDKKTIEKLYENGKANGVPGIEVISGDRAREIEPGLSDAITWALWTPTAGYAEPYEVALACAENAVDNGARFKLNCEVLDVLTQDGSVKGVLTTDGIIEAPVVINAAGVYADEIAEMAKDRFYSIHNRRGTLVILDKENKGKIRTYSGFAPSNYTKGGGPMETPEGTLLFGPSAKEVPDKEDLGVDEDDLRFVLDKAMVLTKGISPDTVITYFSGARAATYNEDFIIENSKKVKGFIHVAGIQSPGFASAPAIAQRVEELYLEQNPKAELDPSFNPIREHKKPFRDCTAEERKARIAEKPAYGRVICRCETVTEGEILDAIHGKIPARTLDAIKRRTRAGMGRCQAGFCGAKVLAILARELGKSPKEVTLKGKGSEVLFTENRPAKGGDRP